MKKKEAGALSGQKGTYVELIDISKNLQNAVIATEDRSFYKMTELTIAVSSWRLSLLVVQVVVLLLPNSWLKRLFVTGSNCREKAKEFFLALELTKKYSKDQILTMYLNNAYFGNGVWGVEDASKKYFGVSASEVSLDQAATLAGDAQRTGIV